MEVVLAVDVGSSSCKCFAYTVNNNIKSNNDELLEHGVIASADTTAATEGQVQVIPGAHAAQPLRAVSPQTGKVIHLEEILEAVDECVERVLQFLLVSSSSHDDGGASTYSIVGVGFSSFTMNLVGVDADGDLVGEEATISYACNTSEVVEEVETIKRELGEEELMLLYQKTGTPIHSAYALPQLRVLYNSQPELCEEIDCWQSLSNMVISRWTGQSPRTIPLSYSEASWSGLLNFRTCAYETTALALLPSDVSRRALPPLLCDFDQCITSGLAPEYQSKWPQLEHASFFLGLGDGASANIGSKCSAAGRIACTIGTSAAARVCVPLPILPQPNPPQQHTAFSMEVPNGLFCYRIDRYHVLVGGALTDGGSVMEWIRNLLNLNDPKDFEDCMKHVGQSVQKAEERAHEEKIQSSSTTTSSRHNHKTKTLTTVPFLSGERSTGHRGGATGVMYGLTRETTATDLVQSCLEGVTLRLGAIIQRIQQTVNSHTVNNNSNSPTTTPQIIVSGKGLEVNKEWRQMIANCTGLPVILDKGTLGGTSRGVAILIQSRLEQSTSAGLLPIEPLDVDNSLCYERQPHSETYWKQLEEQQEGLITAVSPLYSKK